MFHKTYQPGVLEFVEKGPDVQVDHPVHSLAHDPHPERVQCIVLSAPRPEAVAKAQKVLFPYLVENGSDRVLDDLVFQRRDPQRSLPSVRFRNPDSARRLRSIGPTMDSAFQVGEPALQALSILCPSHPVHSGRRLPFQAMVALPQQVSGHMVQQGGELQLPILACRLTHTLQPAWPARPARCLARVRLGRVLLGQRPSLRSLRGRWPVLVRLLRRYYSAVRLPVSVHEGLSASRVLLPARCHVANGRPWGLPVLARGVSPHAWGLGLRRVESRLALASVLVLLSAHTDGVSTRDLDDYGAQCPACGCPCPTLQVRSCGPPSHGSGSGWLATPSLCDSFIRYSPPVYPGAIRYFSSIFSFCSWPLERLSR